MEGILKPFTFYIPTNDQIMYTKAELDRKRFSRRGYFDGNPYQKFLGFLNEVVICDLLNLDRPELPDGEADEGYDFIFDNVKIDVKTRVFNPKYGNPRDPRFDHLVPMVQVTDQGAEVYLFTATNAKNKNIMVCGFLLKNQLLDRAITALKGQTLRKYNKHVVKLKTDNYVVLNNQLEREGDPLISCGNQKEVSDGTA